jgi:tRNA pseudouridine38-40 synthase
MPRFFLQIAYNGTHYHGWQIQPGAESVQGVINHRIATLLGLGDIETVGCGRTDTGVHASHFWLHFDAETMPGSDFIPRLNAFLPQDIAAYRLLEVDAEAHARFGAVSRQYTYRIHLQKDPFLHGQSWQFNGQLDLDLMNQAALRLLDYNDFACFARTGGNNKTTICKVTFAEWQQLGMSLTFTIRADRFLRNMVRAIVGTITDVGRGKMSMIEFDHLLKNGSRSDAGSSAPACGLYLSEVTYPFIHHT